MALDYKAEVAVSNSAFLAELAAGASNGSSLWVNHFIGEPDEGKAFQWAGHRYNPATMAAMIDGWSSANSYFSVASLRADQAGVTKRRKTHFDRMLALVVDDIELDDISGAVSYVVTTSPGKHQVGIFIDRDDKDAADPRLIDGLMHALVEQGRIRLDRSGNSAVRYVRLPVGQNQKPRGTGPFQHQVLIWSPRTRMSLDDAAAAFGVDLDKIRTETQAPETRDRSKERQSDKLRRDIANVVRGEYLHDSLNEIGASLIASGTAPGTTVNLLRGLMEGSASDAARDDRWKSRYAEIPRSVDGAVLKFKRTAPASNEDSQFRLKRSTVNFAVLKPINWVLDGFLASGQVAVFAGQPGVGKSTVFAAMAMVVAGFGQAMGSDIAVSRPRRVVIVSEHSEQYERLFYGMCKRFMVSPAALAEEIILFDAARLAPSEINAEIMQLIEVAGGPEPALVMLDTASASFDVADENSNAEVGAILAALKLPVTRCGCPLWVIAHAAKALGREDPEITPRGASAYIGDVHATGSVFRDKNFKDSTFIKSLKNRNERDYAEIEIKTEVHRFDSLPNEFGEIQRVGIRLGIPMKAGDACRKAAAQASLDAEKARAAEERAAEIDAEIIHTVGAAIARRELLSANAVATEVKAAGVRRRPEDIKDRISALVDGGILARVECPAKVRPNPQTKDVYLFPGTDAAALFLSIETDPNGGAT